MVDKWLVTLSGDQTDLKELAKSCTRPEISVVEREGEVCLESSDFKDTDTANDIWKKADRIIGQLNGACRLALSSLTPLRYTVHQLREDGTKISFVSGSAVGRAKVTGRMTVKRADGTVEEISQADPIPFWMSLARSNPKVATVLELLSEDDWSSWVSLYRIFEVVESDLGSNRAGRQAMVSRGWATWDDIERFRYTANSFNELGKEARHGDEAATRPPSPIPTPMSRAEARALVERILHNWLRGKGTMP